MTITAPTLPASGTPVLNNTGQQISLTITGGTVQSVLVAPQVAPVVATPAVPATTVTAPNNNSFPVQVVIGANGATISAVTVNGSAVGAAAGTYVVPAGGTISISYTVATPTWVWSGLVAGISGNPLSSPQVTILPPGCTVTLVYTVVPTSWTWGNPITEGYSPGYYGSNTQANVNYNTQLPYPAHSQAGQSTLAAAVSN